MNYIIQVVWIIWATFQGLSVQTQFQSFQNAPNIIDYHWIGGLTTNSVQIKIVALPQYQDKLLNLNFDLYSMSRDKQEIHVHNQEYIKKTGDLAFTIDLKDLNEDQEYIFKYQAVINEDKKSHIREGKFKTFKNQIEDFTFIASSCANTMSETNTFNIMKNMNPNFFISVGDIHYSATNRTTTDEFLFAYHEIFKAPQQRQFYESIPLVYTFDDHDFGSNNADGLTFSSSQVTKAYREVVPHYEMASSNPNLGIQQKFKVGKVLFILIDSRTFKNTKIDDTNVTTNLGKDQFNWVLNSVNEAAQSPEIEGVIMIKSYPWYSQREWNENSTFHEKEILSLLIEQLGFNTPKLNKFLAMISGDTHMLTYDTGFLNEHGKFPIFQCSPIDSPPSCKQGGYSGDIFLNRGQFCHFEVSKDPQNNRSCLRFNGFINEKSMMEYSTCYNDVIEKQRSSSEFYFQQSLNETLPNEQRVKYEMAYEMQKMGSTCPVPPKIKIQATMAIFGLVYFVLTAYTILRNICYIRIE